MQIRLGTSGFSYDDWRGVYYPPGLPRGEMLAFYSGARRPQPELLTKNEAEVFDTVEINATYYRLPSERVFAGMAAKTPPGFLFSVKAPGGLTHPTDYTGVDGPLAEAYCAAVTPLAEAGKLGPTLFQFPYRFRFSRANHDYLRSLSEAFRGIEAAVEFRRAEWFTEEGLELVAGLGLTWVSVDAPPLPGLPPPLLAATTPTAYVRFHGRRVESWWKGDNVSRYDYTYSADELRPWATRLTSLAVEGLAGRTPTLDNGEAELAEMIRLLSGPVERVFLFFNNHPRGKAVEAAKALRRLLA